jgi:hypothetical protein
MAVVEYKNLGDVANEFSKSVPEIDKRKKLKILDLGAGTGVGGLKLKEAGFSNIDASDGSTGMLEVAKKLGVYNNFFPEVLIKGQRCPVFSQKLMMPSPLLAVSIHSTFKVTISSASWTLSRAEVVWLWSRHALIVTKIWVSAVSLS